MGKANPKFDLDLKYGQIVEGSIASLLVHVPIEIKADDKAKETGNLCVEFEQFGPDGVSYVPSGIATTTSMWYVFRFDEYRFIHIATEELKRIARRFYRDKSNVRPTGDNGNRSVLVPITAIFPRIELVRDGRHHPRVEASDDEMRSLMETEP